MKKLFVYTLGLLLLGCGSGESGGKEQKPATRNNQRNDAGRQQMPAEDPQPSGGESPFAGDGDQVKDDVNLIQNLKYYNTSVVKSGKQVIVNAANKWLAPGGELSGAIFAAAGEDQVLSEIARNHNGVSNRGMSGNELLQTSQVFTTGAYKLDSSGTKFIIHALGPDFREAPYVTNVERGYEDLRITYQNVYKVMQQLHSRDNTVSSIGIIPISAGVFAGKASKDILYEIMIEETLNAMKAYPEIQPELYLFAKQEYNDVHKVIQKMLPSSNLSAGMKAMTNFALLDAPMVQTSLGCTRINGAATDFGSMRLMTSLFDQNDQKESQVTLGYKTQGVFVGCELETSWNRGEFSHYAFKAISIMGVSDHVSISGGVGVVNENVSVGLSNNIRNFLHSMGLSSADLNRSGAVVDLAARWNVYNIDNVSLSVTVGSRAAFVNEPSYSLSLHSSLKVKDTNILFGISSKDVGISISSNM